MDMKLGRAPATWEPRGVSKQTQLGGSRAEEDPGGIR